MNGEAIKTIISKKAHIQALAEVHDGLAHFGERTTYDFISNTCWWPNQKADTIEYVKSCQICQAHARLQKPDPPMKIPVENVFERIALDFVGPLPESHSGNQYIIVATEALTRWPIAQAVPTADAKTAARFLYDQIVLQFGPPETILTDQGTHFLNKTMERLTDYMGTRHLRTTPYHPQTNGMTERFNGTLCKALAKLAMYDQREWD